MKIAIRMAGMVTRLALISGVAWGQGAAAGYPGKVDWGSSGLGSSLHIGLALFQAATGTKVTHVPYKGAALSLTDVVSGHQPDVYHLGHWRSANQGGRVKVLGVADAKRQPVLPDVPSFAELGIRNADAKVWFGMAAPAKTPKHQLASIH